MACIGAASDDAEVGARLLERLHIDVRLWRPPPRRSIEVIKRRRG
jgi:hypothetical protein